MRVSLGWWLLRLSAKILALLGLSVNFFQLRLTTKLKINFLCFKELNTRDYKGDREGIPHIHPIP